ncbi:MAG: GFA family protein [Polyangiaceae bacterium]
MTQPARLPGRCLCGAVEFALLPPLDFVAHCHCKSCRRAHGAAFVTWTSVPLERFEWIQGRERVRWYRSSETIEWGFCEACGSSMLYRAIAPGHPESPKTDRMYVTVASIDGELGQQPSAHVSFEEHVSWFHPRDLVPKYRGKGEAPIDE